MCYNITNEIVLNIITVLIYNSSLGSICFKFVFKLIIKSLVNMLSIVCLSNVISSLRIPVSVAFIKAFFRFVFGFVK